MDLLTLLHEPLAGQYRLERELGSGGMAVVYLADDLKHGRRVAVKVLRPELGASVGTERFQREITVAAGLQHPNILAVYDSGEVRVGGMDLRFFVMPFVEGESLRDRMGRERQLPIPEALRITREVLGALGAAHSAGIVHRDIKPENVLLSRGHAQVADFGIARGLGPSGPPSLTQDGHAIGTPAYMSPEQAAAEPVVDGRSDLYSTACVLYEMLTGEPPFLAATAQGLLVKRLSEPAPSARRLRETIPVEVDAALQRALARSPADRFATAEEFVAALSTDATMLVTPVPTVAMPARGAGRRWLAWMALAVAALAWLAPWPRETAPPSTPKLALTDLVAATHDSSTEYLRTGIPEFLVSVIRRIPGLEVVPMSTVRRDSSATSPVDLGRRVGATAVLTGSLARYGGTLWVNFELVEVADGRLLWSGQFEYPDTNYAGIVPALVTLIADSLRPQLSGGLRTAVLRHSVVDPVVLDLGLRARRSWLQGVAGATGDSATVDSSRTLYARILARDPHNARALAGMADFYSISYIRGWDVPGVATNELKARSDSLVSLALSIDSALPTA